MSPTELKAVFRRVLMGAAAPLLLSDCYCIDCPHPVVLLDAGFPDGGRTEDGGLTNEACLSLCAGNGAFRCVDVSAREGTPAVQCTFVCAGRSPAGSIDTDLSSLHGVGGYLARMAHFEAASVTAFNQLAEELVALHAPASLVERALKAAHEETMHAELLARALELISACDCADGCPSCVGPAAESGEGGKPQALALLKLLCDSAVG